MPAALVGIFVSIFDSLKRRDWHDKEKNDLAASRGVDSTFLPGRGVLLAWSARRVFI
jgi:hypothetical protein